MSTETSSTDQQPWVMPDWMRAYEESFYNSDGHDIEKLVNAWRDKAAFDKLKRERPDYYLAAIQIVSQVLLLHKLHKEGKLKSS